MSTLKKLMNSTPFKLGVPFMGAVFTAVKFGGLVVPQYLQNIAVFGIVISSLYIFALAYNEILVRISFRSDEAERSKILSKLQEIDDKVAINKEPELAASIKDIRNKITIIEEINKKLLIPQENQENIADEILYQTLAKKYGYANELVEIECELFANGSARVERRIQVLAYAKYNKIDTYLMVPQFLNDEDQEPLQIEASVLDEGRKVELINVKSQLGRTTAELEFFPALIDGISITYKLIERTPPKTYILENTEEELIERKKKDDVDEFFGWNINRPTRKLIIKMLFPEGFIPRNVVSQVRFATAFGFPSIQLQTEEQNRIELPRQEIVTGGRHMIYFSVEFPMTNLIYMLRWLPQLNERSQ